MDIKELLPAIIFMSFCFLFSCAPNKISPQKENLNENHNIYLIPEQPLKPLKETSHSYGGWSCPDNLSDFPPINIHEVKNLNIVRESLQTKEVFFFNRQLSNAKPLDIELPKLARYYSAYTTKNELVVVIQAFVADKDSVVGFRFLNGGSGSAWLSEITFLADEEINKLDTTPFVFNKIEINAPKKVIWDVMTNPKYAKTLGEMFDKNAFVQSEWKANTPVHFKYEPDKIVSSGLITSFQDETYIQVDYNFDGYHYVEKYLLLDNEKNKSAQLYLAAGPYGADYEAQNKVWNNWLQMVKELSEK